MQKTAGTALLKISVGLFAAFFLFTCAEPLRNIRFQDLTSKIAKLPESWKDEAIITISDTVSIKLEPENLGNQVQYKQNTWYYINRKKPEILSQIIIPDFKSIEGIPEINATAYFPEGGKWSVGPLEISRQQYPEEGLYSSDRYFSSFSFPKYQEGMLIHLEVWHTYYRPEFLKSELLRNSFPTLSSVKILTIPKGWDIQYALINNESLLTRSSVEEKDGYKTFSVGAEMLTKLEAASMPRNPESWLAAVHFSFPAQGNRSFTWSELGDRYLTSTGSVLKTTPEMQALADNIVSKDQDSLIRSIYSLVRARIRYHADLELFHSFVPRAAGEVLSKGYGDCKEMASLMTALLRLKGIKAGLALVSTPGTVQVMSAYPSMGGFNHMIVYIEGSDGGIRFFDPTLREGDPFDSYFDLIDRSVLILKEKSSYLTVIPMGANYRNSIHTKSILHKSNDSKGWTLTGSIKLEGQCAGYLRSMLPNFVGEEKTPLLRNYLKEMFSIEASECNLVRADDRACELDFSASFNSNYLSMSNGGFLLTWPSLYGGDVRYSSIQVAGPRYLQKFDQYDTWEIPSEYDELEKSDLKDDLGNGSWSKNGNSIMRSYRNKVAVIQPEKYSIYSDYLRARNRFVKGTVWHR